MENRLRVKICNYISRKIKKYIYIYLKKKKALLQRNYSCNKLSQQHFRCDKFLPIILVTYRNEIADIIRYYIGNFIVTRLCILLM